ncbi:MAG TPA: 16S rRNA (cytosine(967)-C(5))-methyltransferase RsmB [Verrucomicrobiae bacterium]|nr:16S rRNA (cytosine(967)-C(5))-methyltransferase RsmB [Verrucomicrobiae bacterium]
MSGQKPREIAVRILKRHAEGQQFIEEILEEEFAGAHLQPADRRLVQELAFGVVRWQATLDWLIAERTKGRTQKTVLQILLRLGLYQMFWLDRIPDHAAVHETVQMAKETGFGPQSGFINAVLRGYLRERETIEKRLQLLKHENPSLGFSHPPWLCERWEKRWGAEVLQKLLEWNNTPPITFARANTLRTTVENLAAVWEKEGVRFVPRQFDWVTGDLVFELRSHPPLVEMPSFQQGLFYVQDPSTLLAVTFMAPQPGEAILDLCSAPGGKTTFIAQLMNDRGLIMAQDPHMLRRKMVEENCQRLGVTSVRIAAPAEGVNPQLSTPYDRVLVDAPCSNTGVLRRRVDLRWRIQEAEIQRLARRQLDLLESAAKEVRPGGILVYSTCSVEPEENEHVVAKFVEAHKHFALEEERMLLPFNDGVDGAYVARLRRT